MQGPLQTRGKGKQMKCEGTGGGTIKALRKGKACEETGV